MPRRAFYKLAKSLLPDAGIPNAIPLAVVGTFIYLHSCVNPNPELEDLGADLLGSHWSEFRGNATATAWKAVFHTEIDREVDSETRRLTIPMRKTLAGDTVIRADLVPHAFGRDESIAEQEAVDADLAG